MILNIAVGLTVSLLGAAAFIGYNTYIKSGRFAIDRQIRSWVALIFESERNVAVTRASGVGYGLFVPYRRGRYPRAFSRQSSAPVVGNACHLHVPLDCIAVSQDKCAWGEVGVFDASALVMTENASPAFVGDSEGLLFSVFPRVSVYVVDSKSAGRQGDVIKTSEGHQLSCVVVLTVRLLADVTTPGVARRLLSLGHHLDSLAQAMNGLLAKFASQHSYVEMKKRIFGDVDRGQSLLKELQALARTAADEQMCFSIEVSSIMLKPHLHGEVDGITTRHLAIARKGVEYQRLRDQENKRAESYRASVDAAVREVADAFSCLQRTRIALVYRQQELQSQFRDLESVPEAHELLIAAENTFATEELHKFVDTFGSAVSNLSDLHGELHAELTALTEGTQ